MSGLDRRQFIARGALLAASAAGLPRLAAPAVREARRLPALAPAAAGHLPPPRRGAAARARRPLRATVTPPRAASAFASAYAAGDDASRAHADAVLDAVPRPLPARRAAPPAATRRCARGRGGGSPSPAEAPPARGRDRGRRRSSRARRTSASRREGPALAMSSTLRKLVDIGPGGVDLPRLGAGSALRAATCPTSPTPARAGSACGPDWPSLQPHPDYAPDDPRSPGAWQAQALDEQIRLANARGIKVMLMPYRFPTWVNGTSTLSAQKNTDARSPPPADRMTKAAWDRYVRNGATPRLRPAAARSSTCCPTTPTGRRAPGRASSTSSTRRYHDGRARPAARRRLRARQRAQPAAVAQQAPSGSADPWAPATSIEARRRLMKTAQGISARYAHSTMLYAPSISDTTPPRAACYTRWDEFVPEAARRAGGDGLPGHSRQAWSHHNYTDVERRRTATRTQSIRGAARRAAGPATPRAARRRSSSTEGGARLSRMPALYPPRIRARRRRSACATRGRCTSATAAPGPAWRCSRSTCSTPTPTSTAVCSTRIRAR